MNQAITVFRGFYLASSVIFALFASSFWFYADINKVVGVAFFLLLAIPFIANLVIKIGWREKTPTQTFSNPVNTPLMALQGVGFACWFLDVITTFLVIDVGGMGTELNPLGWPYGIIGALIYFIPASISVYFLLYKLKAKWSFYGAVVLTAITLCMASLSLTAGLINFGNTWVPTETSSNFFLINGFWIPIVVILSAINIAEIILETRKRSKQLRHQA